VSEREGPLGKKEDPPGPQLAGVTAVVLTYMRRRLAGDVTRSLCTLEGLSDDRIVVVVNGLGGLDAVSYTHLDVYKRQGRARWWLD